MLLFTKISSVINELDPNNFCSCLLSVQIWDMGIGLGLDVAHQSFSPASYTICHFSDSRRVVLEHTHTHTEREGDGME